MMEKDICLCRVRCQRKSLSAFLQLIMAVTKNESMEPTEDFFYQFFSYTGPTINNANWGKYLEDIFGSKSTANDKQWEETEAADFNQADKKQLICELVIRPEDDLSNIQYLLLGIHALFHNGIPCTVLVSGGKRGPSRYTPLENGDYFRLSHQMYFYAPFSTEIQELLDIYDQFFVCSKGGGDGRDYHWIVLPRKYSSTVYFGRIIPQIPITHQSYHALVSSYNLDPSKEWQTQLRSLCVGYYNKLTGIFETNKSVIENYMSSDSYFETALFLALCCYISEDPLAVTEMDKQDIDSLHEICMNFSQGILQLVDNVVSHVLGDNEDNGCGILTVRFRKAGDAQRLYLADSQVFQGVDYFMELYLTDLQYGNFMGIVDKFKDNVKKRRDAHKTAPGQRLVHSKFYLSQNLDQADALIEEEPPYLQKDLRAYIETTECKGVSLANFFDEGDCEPFFHYISAAENIAFHYGLPILNSVVLLQNGYLHVQSGDGESNIFDNVQKSSPNNAQPDSSENAQTNSPYRKIDDLVWNHGTAFMVYMPLKSRKPIGEFDSLVPMNNSTDSLYRHHTFSPGPESLRKLEPKKEVLTLALKEQIKKDFDGSGSEDVQIGVIDCGQTISALNLPRLDAYEIIVKALFLYLADADANIDKLALINIAHEYDVIKLFRLFALFFNRAGRNELLSKEKSLFLVDCNGKVDILFYGNNLKSICDSLSYSRLYGGTAEDAIKIIQYLLEGRHV